jgi:chromosome segregation ATPase
MRNFQIVLSVLFFLLSIGTAYAQESKNDKKHNPSVEERLIRLEEGQKSILAQFNDTNKRIDDLRADLNSRFNDMNNRFEDLNSKFNWIYGLLSALIALIGVMVGSVVWLARQDRPIGQRHYDILLANDERFENEISKLSKDLSLIKARLELTE